MEVQIKSLANNPNVQTAALSVIFLNGVFHLACTLLTTQLEPTTSTRATPSRPSLCLLSLPATKGLREWGGSPSSPVFT